jgi:membrane protein YdbS with pleckstrin-like domain
MASVTASPLRLRVPANLVSARAKRYWAARALVGWVVIVGVELLIGLTSWSGALTTAVVAPTALLAAAHIAVMPRWRYRVHRWEATAEAVYTQAGWLSQERRVAPIARIQTVDTQRGPFEQAFGLSNVTVTTASAAGPLRIRGLDRSVADRLVEELTARTSGEDGDGT